MAKNLGREFATMDDDERRRFAGRPEEAPDTDRPEEVAFDDPRDADRMGRHVMEDSPLEEIEERNEMAESGAVPPAPRRRARGRGRPPRSAKPRRK